MFRLLLYCELQLQKYLLTVMFFIFSVLYSFPTLSNWSRLILFADGFNHEIRFDFLNIFFCLPQSCMAPSSLAKSHKRPFLCYSSNIFANMIEISVEVSNLGNTFILSPFNKQTKTSFCMNQDGRNRGLKEQTWKWIACFCFSFKS